MSEISNSLDDPKSLTNWRKLGLYNVCPFEENPRTILEGHEDLDLNLSLNFEANTPGTRGLVQAPRLNAGHKKLKNAQKSAFVKKLFNLILFYFLYCFLICQNIN